MLRRLDARHITAHHSDGGPQCGGSGPASTSFLNSSINSGSRRISRSKKVLTADDPRCYDFEMATGSPLTLRRKDRLELLLSAAGMDRPSTIMLCKGGAGDRVSRSFAFYRLRRRTPDAIASNFISSIAAAEEISSLCEKLAQIDITPAYRILFAQNRDRRLVRRFQQPLSSLRCWLAIVGNSGSRWLNLKANSYHFATFSPSM
jgi:hypothetical protein